MTAIAIAPPATPKLITSGGAPVVRFRDGPILFTWFTPHARPDAGRSLILFGPSPREAVQDLLRRLGREPRSVRATDAGTGLDGRVVELRSADDPIGDGVVLCVVGGTLDARAANDVLFKLDRDGWGPDIP